MKALCLFGGQGPKENWPIVSAKLKFYFNDAKITIINKKQITEECRTYFKNSGFCIISSHPLSWFKNVKIRKYIEWIILTYNIIVYAPKNDLLFIFGSFEKIGPIGLVVAKLYKMKSICRINGYCIYYTSKYISKKNSIIENISYYIMRYILKNFDLVFFNSETNMIDHLELCNVNKSLNHWVIPPGVDESQFRKQYIKSIDLNNKFIKKEKEHVLGSVFNIRPIKNLEFILETLYILVKQYGYKILYLHAGAVTDKEYKKKIDNMLEALGLTDYVIFLGPVKNNELKYLYSFFDITLLTSKYESFGLSITESYLCETPCIAMNHTGMKDQILHGQTGFLVNENDKQALANYIKVLFENKNLRNEFATLGRNYVLKYFTYKGIGKKIKGVYKKLCN